MTRITTGTDLQWAGWNKKELACKNLFSGAAAGNDDDDNDLLTKISEWSFMGGWGTNLDEQFSWEFTVAFCSSDFFWERSLEGAVSSLTGVETGDFDVMVNGILIGCLCPEETFWPFIYKKILHFNREVCSTFDWLLPLIRVTTLVTLSSTVQTLLTLSRSCSICAPIGVTSPRTASTLMTSCGLERKKEVTDGQNVLLTSSEIFGNLQTLRKCSFDLRAIFGNF